MNKRPILPRLKGLPLSPRGDRLRGLGLPSLRAEHGRRRRPAGRAGRHRQQGGDPAAGEPVGAQFARCIRRDRPGAADKQRIDGGVIAINGVNHWLWRAVDANGDVPDILVQPRRNAKAAKRFLKRLIARFGDPRVVVTDKLRSAIKPVRDLTPNADRRAHKGLSNRIEGSHRPTRKREKIMGRFKFLRQAQRFLSAHD